MFLFKFRKFNNSIGKQGYSCTSCSYACHTKCVKLIPNNCTATVRDPNSKKSIQRTELDNMVDLATALKNGIEVKDRKTLLKNFPNSFTGEDAINWILRNLPIRDREESLQICAKLMNLGFIKSFDNKQFKDGDSNYYYFDTIENIKLKEQNEKEKVVEENVTLEEFEIIKTIGKGGFGKVVKVTKKDNKKIYAMKIMNKTKLTNTRQLQCLIAEKNIMLNDNPFLVHLHYSFQTEDKLYFVMDYISNGDLSQHLSMKGRFNEKEIRFIIAEIVLALEHLHGCGIIYRDLKLENILMDKEGHICLTDFGLSKELESIQGTTKTVCGTPTYLSVEVLLGQPYSIAIDYWYLGVVAYELFTGTNPFDAKDFDSVLSNILHSPIIVPDYVPKDGKDLIEKLLQRNPTKRLCSGPTGSDEIQNHPFFKSIDWKKLMVKQIKPIYKTPSNNNDVYDPSLQDVEEPKGPSNNSDKQIVLDNFTYVSKSVVNNS